jgi:hypothetical protein
MFGEEYPFLVLYEYEIWPVVLMEEYRLRVFQNMLLKTF